MDMNNYLMGQYYVFKMQNKILYKIDEKAFSNADIYAVYRDIYPINNESKKVNILVLVMKSKRILLRLF